MSQPLDRNHEMPRLGDVDEERGEFWIDNPFKIARSGENLSAYERNRVFMNLDGESFIDVSFVSGADIDSDSRSVICADFNNDGATDALVCSVGGGPLRLFLNRFPRRGSRVKLELEGTTSNRLAIGARATLHCGDRRIIRDNFPANGFMGQGPPGMVIGVGEAEVIDKLEIRWPTGQTQVFNDAPVDAKMRIVEGNAKIVVEPF